ncbi:7688_t:CDS:1 [Dentiscutata heterogama]|uniref:7688_t:CDS:1 n=1 Tax=Dentiscutata heterogama TaxID=1316150 RepID=A0ACA9LEC5_9GLOM|nr:7688_t:CDS:1 [Dentiscutata heterogama]
MSFAELLHRSRLATFDPSLPQVYTSCGRYKIRGEWGLKRNLPPFLRTNFITVNALDTIEHQTPYKSAQTMVKFTKCWKENFPLSKMVKPRKNEPSLINIGKMSDKEFKRFLKEKVEPRKHEWRKLIKEFDLTASTKVGDKESSLTSVETATKKHPTFDEFLNITYERRPPNVQGLTYSHNNPGTNIKVQGRILNRDIPGGFAVGISGMVANLVSQKATLVNRINREKIESFYVEKAEFNEYGKPSVRISKAPVYSTNDGLYSYDGVGSRKPFRHFFDSATPRRLDDGKDEEEILTRIRSLLSGISENKENDEKNTNNDTEFTKIKDDS